MNTKVEINPKMLTCDGCGKIIETGSIKKIKDIKKGDIFIAKVVKILSFGALVELTPGQEGLIHISELANHRVRRVEDIVKEGHGIPVRVKEIDKQKRISLTAINVKVSESTYNMLHHKQTIHNCVNEANIKPVSKYLPDLFKDNEIIISQIIKSTKVLAPQPGKVIVFDIAKDIGIIWGKKPNEIYWFTSSDCPGDTLDIKDGDEIHFSRIIGGGKRVTNVIKKDGELTNVAASKTKIDANKERRKLAQMFAYGEITKEIFEQRLKQLDGESTTSTIAGQDTARQKYINGEITKEQYENLKES